MQRLLMMSILTRTIMIYALLIGMLRNLLVIRRLVIIVRLRGLLVIADGLWELGCGG